MLTFTTYVVKWLKEVFDNNGGLKRFKRRGHVETNQKTKNHVVVYMSQFEELDVIGSW